MPSPSNQQQQQLIGVNTKEVGLKVVAIDGVQGKKLPKVRKLLVKTDGKVLNEEKLEFDKQQHINNLE